MAEPSERLESDRLDSIRLFQDSVHWEGKVFDVLIKNGCSKEDLVNVSSMLQTIYMCGFEVLILSNFEYIQYLLDIIDKQNKIIKEQNEILYMNGIDVLYKEKGR